MFSTEVTDDSEWHAAMLKSLKAAPEHGSEKRLSEIYLIRAQKSRNLISIDYSTDLCSLFIQGHLMYERGWTQFQTFILLRPQRKASSFGKNVDTESPLVSTN